MKQIWILIIFIFLILVLNEANHDKLRKEIIQLKTDNATQWQQIRANNKDTLFLTDGFFDEYRLTKEEVDYIIKMKKWRRKHKPIEEGKK